MKDPNAMDVSASRDPEWTARSGGTSPYQNARPNTCVGEFHLPILMMVMDCRPDLYWGLGRVWSGMGNA
jgi:hypothetical protein